MKYTTRWKLKYAKSYKYNRVTRCAAVLRYIIIDALNVLLLFLAKKTPSIDLNTHKKILFIEPQKQGYGDLLFQTPLFQYIGSQCVLDIFCQPKHACILENNPFVMSIFSEDKAVNFNEYDCVFYLSRSTIKENILALKCSSADKVPLDGDLAIWTAAFRNYSCTKAWQIIFDSIFKKNHTYTQSALFIDRMQKNDNLIIMVAGTERKDKGIQNIEEVAQSLCRIFKGTDYTIEIVGKTEEHTTIPTNPRITNLINKISYKECMEHISSARLVIGPEGSLIHVSTSLGTPTIVGEYGRAFKMCSEITNANIFLTDTISASYIERSLPKILDGLHG
ncbi:hypothetical protein A2524_02755 [Candidatus Wolfebacteria bacterium RIFOXYD12_FULL_48_21]|nr:MAG: hypothetical protein A2524_02755 [Candidatus Wolfebacteria bacterium RIFOXYD12_FULL_48_21]